MLEWVERFLTFCHLANVTSAENGFSFTSMTKGESLEKKEKNVFCF